MCLGTFMAILDTSLVNLGLHAIRRDLHSPLPMLQWVIDLYNLAYAALILTGGALGDLYGRRRIFAIGGALFAVGSVICALSPNVGVLIAGRGVAGVGAALELPAALAILNVTYPEPRRRAGAIAIWGGMNGLAMAIGPTLGGVLVDDFGWRSLFWVIVPVAVVMVALAMWCVPETRDPRGRHLDLTGQVLAIVGLASLSLVFIDGPSVGWRSPIIVACAVAFLVSAALFPLVERRSPRPLVPLDVFKSRPFSCAVLNAGLMTFGMYGLLFVLPLYFQSVRHSTATGAGIALLPLSVLFFLVSLLAGRAATTIGPRVLIGCGMALTGGGLVALAFLRPQTVYAAIAVPLGAIGIGLGLITGPIANVAVANAPRERSGMASGLVNMGRLIGATLGVAVLGILFGGRAEQTAGNAGHFMAGLHATFLIGGVVELAGAAIAMLWLRANSLGTKEVRVSGPDGARRATHSEHAQGISKYDSTETSRCR